MINENMVELADRDRRHIA